MSTAEILDQLARLTAEEREAIRSRLDAIESSAPLTQEEKQFIADRVTAYRQNPNATVSWAAAEADIRKQLGM